MSEQTTEQTRESDSDADVSVAAEPQANEETTGTLGRYVSIRALVVAFVAIGGGMTLTSLIPLVPYTAVLGIPVGAFLHGLLDRDRRYVETAVASSVLAGVVGVLPLLPQLLAGMNSTRLFAVAASVGLVLGLVGHYFGRDLRAGLTRDVSESE